MRGKKLENEIQNEILDYLEKGNFCYWRSNNVPVYARNNAGKYAFRKLPKHTPKGLPDIMVVVEGKFVGIEVKREGVNTISEHQEKMRRRIEMNGGIYIIATSVLDLLTYDVFNNVKVC